ncbi:hypothetical protein D3C85_1733530 [compost metagenome]
MPQLVEPVRSLIQPIAYGLTKAARPANELIPAMPAAALLPSRKAVGRLQNNGEHTMQPAAATDSMATASIGL